MAPGGTIFPLGISGGNLAIQYMPIIQKGLRIQGVLVACKTYGPFDLHCCLTIFFNSQECRQ
jgi:hypothetical protein